MNFVGLHTICKRTFNRHQKDFLSMAVHNIWHREQMSTLAGMQDNPLAIAGDARHDSMGHSAKYGTYTTMEMNSRKIIDFQVIQVDSP
jgi:solute carrier family 8 (sodium/calcium exchanger)